jgi:hypothetical protein
MERIFLGGIALGAGFGIVWAFWAASVVAGPGGMILRTAGLVVGVGAVLMAVKRALSGGRDQGKPTRTTGRNAPPNGLVFLVIVLGEVAAIRGGELVLTRGLDIQVLDAAWVACVVGLHFLAMGRFLHLSFAYVLGSVITAASLGATFGYAVGGSGEAVTLIAALPTGAVLLASSWYGLISGARTSLPAAG